MNYNRFQGSASGHRRNPRGCPRAWFQSRPHYGIETEEGTR